VVFEYDLRYGVRK